MMAAYAQDAVEYAKRSFGVTPDYSGQSVEAVEGILEKLHQSIPRSVMAKVFRKRPGQKDIDQLAKTMGGYVGEAMRRHWGGE